MNEKKTVVISIDAVRKKRLLERRKATQRILFQHAMSVYALSSRTRMVAIQLIDVSSEGLSFFAPRTAYEHHPIAHENLTVRVYFTSNTFFELHLLVRNSKDAIINGTRGLRYGCSIPEQQSNYTTYKHFIEFLKSYAQNAKIDKQIASI